MSPLGAYLYSKEVLEFLVLGAFILCGTMHIALRCFWPICWPSRVCRETYFCIRISCARKC